jgi:hypothetical protein
MVRSPGTDKSHKIILVEILIQISIPNELCDTKYYRENGERARLWFAQNPLSDGKKSIFSARGSVKFAGFEEMKFSN